MSVVRSSVLLSAVDRYLTQVLVVGTTAVMARILTPTETGLFLIANAFILLSESLRDFGVGIYLIQARNLERAMVQSAFTVTFLLSLAIGSAIYVGAGRIASFYGEPGLGSLLVVASLGFLIVPFGSPIVALLRRDLAFGVLAAVNVAAAVANASTTIVLGLAGFGAVSYVWGYVIASALLTVLAVIIRPELWIFRPSFADARNLFTFGAVSSAVTIVNMAYDQLPRLVLGKVLGFDAVGLYSRAVTVCQLPDRAIVSALQPVVLPAMAARMRASGNLKRAYLRGHELMSAIQWPALIMLALLADPVVRILLGSQWDQVPPLVRVIALGMMPMAPAFMTFPVLVSMGRIRDALISSLISLPPSILIVLAVAPHGIGAVAASVLVTAPLQMFVALLFVRRAIGLTWRELAAVSRASVVVSVATATVPVTVVALSPGFALTWPETLLAGIGAAGGWLAGVWFAKHPIRDEIAGAWRIVMRAVGRRGTPAANPE